MNARKNLQRRSLRATGRSSVRHAQSLSLSRASANRGVALIAWLGVLAVIAILLAFLLPALIRETDFQVARGESATLKTLGNALQSAIQHQSYIPSAAQTDWASLVSAETGMAIASITNNPRNQPRVLLIDTNGWFGTAAGVLPYTQNYAGTTNLPLNTRMMIATSVGQPLPISGGPLSASSFSNLWNAAEGTLPATAPWTTWTGQPGDVKLERINLLPLFITLRLATYPASTTNIGYYSVGNNNNLYPALALNNQSPAPPSYYLKDTVLRLYVAVYQPSPSVHLDSTQILNQDASFLYENGVWKSSAAGGIMPGGVDIASIVDAFLNAPPNLNAQNGADQQRLVALAMVNYMSNYVVWANGNFTDNNLKSYLSGTVQPNMMNTVQGLFMGSYYPANNGPCQ